MILTSSLLSSATASSAPMQSYTWPVPAFRSGPVRLFRSGQSRSLLPIGWPLLAARPVRAWGAVSMVLDQVDLLRKIYGGAKAKY